MDPAVAEALVKEAAEARRRAYIPYSHFAVGAALLTRSGKVYTGCNIENASYGLTVCAERVAIWKAVSEGEREFVALAVVTADGVSPCGACRQVMAEFAPEMPVLIAAPQGVRRTATALELLPGAFLPDDLRGRH
ncbi:MAG: cytidine deaminase [Anaerolineae bacterium]|nr:cytidine deaminase [Anaerolineae bacterium]